MFELVIKRPDGSAYTTEHFGSIESAKKWLETEQTRPYWDSNFTYQFIDRSPPPMSDEDKAALAKAEGEKQKNIGDLKQRLHEITDLEKPSQDEVNEFTVKLFKLLKVKGLLE